jgi:hypothetical protein
MLGGLDAVRRLDSLAVFLGATGGCTIVHCNEFRLPGRSCIPHHIDFFGEFT